MINLIRYLVLICGIAAFSACSAPLLIQGGEANLSLSVGGVLPSPMGQNTGSKALLPGTIAVRVTVNGDGFSRQDRIAVGSTSSSVTVSRLPVGKLLTITVEALNNSGTVLSSWTITQTLSRGSNQLSATLTPVNMIPILATVTPTTMLQLGGSQVVLANGDSKILKLTFSAAGEFQLVANTGKAEYAWLNAYDSNWQALPAIARDEGQGWLVIAVRAGDTVNVAVASTAGNRTVDVQARYARFVSNAGTANNPGSSASPFGLLSQAAMDKAAVFMGGGIYFENGPTGANLSGVNCAVYGGFNPLDWHIRDSASYVSKITSNTNSSSILNLAGTSSRILIDGLRIKAASITGTNPSSCGLSVGNAATDQNVISNCIIEGPDCAGVASSVSAVGVIAKSGNLELANCVVDGGNAISTSNVANSCGFQVINGNAYVHGSTIKGGFASTSSANQVNSYGYYQSGNSGSQVIAGSTILGGSAVSATGSAFAFGVYLVNATTNRSIVANNVIYAGYARSDISRLLGLSVGVMVDSQTALISGNTIIVQSVNAGKSNTSGISPCVSIGAKGVAVVQYNLFQSAGSANDQPISIELSGTLSALIGNCVLNSTGNAIHSPNGDPIYAPAGGYAGLPNIISSTVYGNILPNPFQTAGSTLSNFDLSGLGGSAGDSAAWLAVNRWWPNAVGLALFVIPNVRADGFTSAETTAYPAILLDRGGYARSNAQYARLGAYEYSTGY